MRPKGAQILCKNVDLLGVTFHIAVGGAADDIGPTETAFTLLNDAAIISVQSVSSLF